jgi:endo-1,4-beta-xylanase
MNLSVWTQVRAWACLGGLVSAAVAADDAAPSLKEAARGVFHVGVALNAAQVRGEDPAAEPVVARHFDSITAENAMKWDKIHPEPGRYDFTEADEFVAYGVKHGMQTIGHTLIWHSQTPDWVFQGPDGKDAPRELLLQRLREHIATVVGRYRGKVRGWDVVNESVRDEDGALRLDKPWYRILGQDAVFAAFEAAHQADPDAELYYNDYSLENLPKREGALKLVQAIRARGLRIDGVGNQDHVLLDWPEPAAVDRMIEDFARAGFKMMITEFDITMLPRPEAYNGADIGVVFQSAPHLDPYRGGLPAAQQAILARRYAELFAAFARHRGAVTRVTLWGVSDRGSWLNDWPIRGRTDHPLLFDRSYRPKAALRAVIDAIESTTRAPAH